MVSASKAEGIVLTYMKQQNRPFNVQTVVDNLHKEVKKSEAQKAMDALTESGKLVCKTYGKQKIYMVDQSDIDVPSPEEAKLEMASIEEKKQKEAELLAELARTRAVVSALQASPTDEELVAKLTTLDTDITDAKAKLKLLRDGTDLIDPNAIANMQAEFKHYAALWRKRKATCMDTLGQISEGANKRIKDLISDMSIDTDESENIALRDLVTLMEPGKA